MVSKEDARAEMIIRIKYYCAVLLLVSGFQAGLLAQVNERTADGKLSHLDTIARSVEDLKSRNVDTRVGAIMLLSKYTDTEAILGVASGLTDPHVRVRRAALVSMVEKQNSIPPEVIESVLMLVDDEDAEIRRMVSSSLGLFLSLWNNYFSGNVFAGRRQELPRGIQNKMISVFLDEDVVVRRNMLSYFVQLDIHMPDVVLENLLSDVDNQVRLEALRLAYRISRFNTIVKMGDGLKDDRYQAIRMMFAHILGVYAGEESRELLEYMLKDRDPEVVVQAELALFRQNPSLVEAERLVGYLFSNRFNQEQGESYIETVSHLRSGSLALLEKILTVENTEYRLAALRHYSRDASLRENEVLFLTLSNDSSNRIRRQVINFFRMNRDDVSFDLVDGLVMAKYVDVREFAVMLTRALKKEDSEMLLLDFLIDEEVRVRLLALSELIVSEYEGASNILRLSLKDSDFQMQRQAVLMLINLNDPAELDFLKSVYKENPDSQLGSVIKSLMRRRAGVKL